MKIYVWRGPERFGPFSSTQDVQIAIDSGAFSLASTSPGFWFDEEYVLPGGLAWDWDGRQWHVVKKTKRTPEQEQEVYRRINEYGRYVTELWKWSPEESVRFANLLPPEREEEYGKSVPPDEREARRLRGLRPFVSRPRYTWERVRLWFILAAIVVGVLGATRACKKDDGNTPDEPAEVSDQ